VSGLFEALQATISRATNQATTVDHDNRRVTTRIDVIADAVLAMPEMEAIKEALADMTRPYRWSVINDAHRLEGHRYNLAEIGLPESVIAWVLDGDQ
jgi:hypothetical protein